MSAVSAGTRRHGRKVVLGTVLALIGAPAVLVPIEAALFHVRFRSSGSVVSSGETRDYVLYVPNSYDRTTPTPLVISMHGAGLWGAAQRDMSGWDAVAERHGLIVVYPSGGARGGLRIWHVDRGPRLMKDVRFISELIDTLEAAYNIDPTRIYADGLSNGGGMAFVLSCTLSDRIAAVGMVAAAQLLPWSWCTDRRPVPMIALHGTADPLTPYLGGRTWVAPERFPSIPAWTAGWARRNRCAASPVAAAVAADVTRLEYPRCADDAAVVLYTVHGGGHSWPGGRPPPEWLAGSTSTSIDASSEMWAFFREHPLRQTKSPGRQN